LPQLLYSERASRAPRSPLSWTTNRMYGSNPFHSDDS